MSYRQLLSAVTLWIMTAFILSTAEAQVVRPQRTTAAGILTDRLPAKQLERWRRIERIVFDVDEEGHILHPVLHALWKWVDTSGHAIYIEIPEPQKMPSGTAGTFRLERFDPTGQRHIGVIRLNLSSIDNAYASPATIRPDGLIPFEGLGKEERYAEVLGHELAHAEDILLNLERACLVDEHIEQTNDLVLSQLKASASGAVLGTEMRQRLHTRDFLLQRLEAYAEMVETLVWRELLAGQPASKRR